MTVADPRSSRLPGFFRLSSTERIEAVAAFAGLSSEELLALQDPDGLPQSIASSMSENVVGRFSLPISFATNFRVNSRDFIVPMVIEEPSVVAAASFAARLLRAGNGGAGIVATATEDIMIGQVHFPDPPDKGILEALIAEKGDILKAALDGNHPRLCAAGGGYRSARVRYLVDPDGRPLSVVHLHIDVRDAMGANAVNSMAEEAGALFEAWTGCRVGLRILSNLPTHRRVQVVGRVALKKGGGLARWIPTKQHGSKKRVVLPKLTPIVQSRRIREL